MLVPTSRLLWWVALVALPFSLLAAVEPRALPLSAAAMGLLALAAVADAVLGARKLQNVSLELPPTVRLSKDRAGSFDVRIRNRSRQGMPLRLALDLPPQVRTPLEEQTVRLPEGSEWSRISWPCTPVMRGRYVVSLGCLETPSTLKLWAIRKSVPTACEIRSYPNLLQDRRHLAALFLRRGALGLHAQRQIGKGREFEKLREYVSGDGFDEIHWKATAKRSRPITKVFQIERTQEIYVIIDGSRLSAKAADGLRFLPQPRGDGAPGAGSEGLHGGADSNLLERFITAALVMGLAAEQQGDLFGVLTFSDRVDHFLRARNGKAHYSACRDALYTLQPRLVTPDYDELCSYIRLRLRRRALLVFLTALDDPTLAESFVRNIDLVCRRHLVLVNMIQPPGIEPVFAGADVGSEDEIYERLGGHLAWHNLRELGTILRRRGVQFSLLKNERLAVDLVSQYLAVKKRQAL